MKHWYHVHRPSDDRQTLKRDLPCIVANLSDERIWSPTIFRNGYPLCHCPLRANFRKKKSSQLFFRTTNTESGKWREYYNQTLPLFFRESQHGFVRHLMKLKGRSEDGRMGSEMGSTRYVVSNWMPCPNIRHNFITLNLYSGSRFQINESLICIQSVEIEIFSYHSDFTWNQFGEYR